MRNNDRTKTSIRIAGLNAGNSIILDKCQYPLKTIQNMGDTIKPLAKPHVFCKTIEMIVQLREVKIDQILINT